MLSRSFLTHRGSRLLASLRNKGGRMTPAIMCGPTGTIDMQEHFFSSTPIQGEPFRVLVANRGEIVQRVARTCQQYPDLFETVVVYSTADAKAPFVAEATGPKVCIGPAAASQSYLNVEKILQTIDETGAHMVHPGYGFLSENADFATTITNKGAVWLGPSPHAIKELGDKLRSKEVALEAGVNIVPGFEGVLESVDQALSLAQDIGYPVLLKAAAGGGGKGMRVCQNDQDLKEAFSMAKSEAKSFFSDDRLLIEKYIEESHHIEFQVLCCKNKDGEIDVVVFPERECSIQRRNQKVIEESPSVLLKEETRLKMVSQVRQLCKTVGYESAGTIEFMVEHPKHPDDPQNFYFLEMNTRLQVEHPVSEAACGGVDLVKGMLWIGAGWGLPDEFKTNEPILPFKGHAIEARIYAEDPLRGFLPSTGPLHPYVEPPLKGLGGPEEYCRMDSGVANGHVVTPWYDPMLSKTIYYASTRQRAVEGLATALDQYIIEGVQHNARLVNAVLRHPEFKAGNTPTSFLPTHYPDGFHGVQLDQMQEEELAVASAMIQRKKHPQTPEKLVVQLGGLFGKAFQVSFGLHSAEVQFLTKDPEGKDGEVRTISIDSVKEDGSTLNYQPRKYLAQVSLDDKSRFIQVIKEDASGELYLQMYGANMPVVVQSEREFHLSKHMKEPPKLDTSDIVPSPMPGTVMSYAVKAGETVEIGQELCIVEAMKMQNIIRSPRAGVIASLDVDVGSSVAADQVIVRLEPEVSDEGDESDHGNDTSPKAA